jgi:nucleotide-binding universal stress UspA family protein
VSLVSATPTPTAATRAATADPIFGFVLVAVDTTPTSMVAASQARCVCAPDGYLELLGIAETHLAAHAGFTAPNARDQLVTATRDELEAVRELVEPDSFRLVEGSIAEALVAEATRQSATLAVLGASPHRRLTSRLFGGPDLPVLRDAPCSVLVARPGWGGRRPARVLVGVDGSPESAAAEAAARTLAARLGCDFAPVIALGGKPIESALLHTERDDALLDPREACAALSGAPEDSLVVLGGRLGERPGSVCAHVAHEARCSVLVVRHAA